ncbi:hypothetical protein HY639_01355 [Candidatus Woesearchaeota archaeon]|nr:hypothetical protein [Candidatus Woesearchaeota archaeon]
MATNLETRLEREGNVCHIYKQEATYTLVSQFDHDEVQGTQQLPDKMDGLFLEGGYESIDELLKLLGGSNEYIPQYNEIIPFAAERHVPVYFPDCLNEEAIERAKKMLKNDSLYTSLMRQYDKTKSQQVTKAIEQRIVHTMKQDNALYTMFFPARELAIAYKEAWLAQQHPHFVTIMGSAHGLEKSLALSQKEKLCRLRDMTLHSEYMYAAFFPCVVRFDYDGRWEHTKTDEIPELKRLL